MAAHVTLHETIGLAKTEVDAHTLGLAAIDEILQECGFNTIIAEDVISKAFSEPRKADNSSLIEKWIRQNNVSVLGFSYRLNVDDAVLLFQMLMYQLDDRKLLEDAGGPVKKVCFAGLPAGDIDRLNFRPSGKNLGLIMTVEPLAKIGVKCLYM